MSGVLPYRGVFPSLEKDVFVAPGARIIGDVTVGARAGVWFNAVIRGDEHFVRVGAETNVQDGSVLHVTGGEYPLEIGERVTIGHRAVMHGCVVEDECLVGIGAVILDGARIGRGALVAAGCVVPPGFRVPAGSLVAGVPAVVRRELAPEELEQIRQSAAHYVRLASEYLRPAAKKPLGFLG